jgi:hypothetical protein
MEGLSGKYILEDITPETFKLFVQYLYYGKVTFRYHKLNSEDDIQNGQESHGYACGHQDMVLVELFALADRFMIIKLQNLVVDQIVRSMRSCGRMRMTGIEFIFDHTVEGHPLRRLACEQICLYGSAETLALFARDFPEDVMFDMVIYLKGLTSEDKIKKKRLAIKASDYYIRR